MPLFFVCGFPEVKMNAKPICARLCAALLAAAVAFPATAMPGAAPLNGVLLGPGATVGPYPPAP